MPYHHSRVFLRFLSTVILLALLAGMAPPAIADSSASQEGRSSAAFAQISFVPNIETAGVVVSGSSLPKQAQLTYRRAGELNWRTGHPVMRIDDGRLIGSLFDLSPSTSYEVKVSDGATEIVGTVTTQPDELSFVPSSVIYVDSNAPLGGDGSSAAPLRSIQEAVNRAGPGTQVLVADGVYREEITFPASGTAGNWIQVKAQGGGAIWIAPSRSLRMSGSRMSPRRESGLRRSGHPSAIWHAGKNGFTCITITEQTCWTAAGIMAHVSMKKVVLRACHIAFVYAKSAEDPHKYSMATSAPDKCRLTVVGTRLDLDRRFRDAATTAQAGLRRVFAKFVACGDPQEPYSSIFRKVFL
jgi:hypothetical protein